MLVPLFIPYGLMSNIYFGRSEPLPYARRSLSVNLKAFRRYYGFIIYNIIIFILSVEKNAMLWYNWEDSKFW